MSPELDYEDEYYEYDQDDLEAHEATLTNIGCWTCGEPLHTEDEISVIYFNGTWKHTACYMNERYNNGT